MIGARFGLGKVLLQMAENVSKIQEYAVSSSSVSKILLPNPGTSEVGNFKYNL